MAPKFPVQNNVVEKQMTTQDIIDACGDVEVESLEEVEIIFGNFTEIGGLEPCSSLLSLTLVNCGLRRLSNFTPVSMTLERLCLPDQQLTKIEGLHLPCLRELHLQQNKISTIEGLEGVPHLQRLWLWGNQISRIEGLTGCGELRELYLQDNRINRLNGVSSLIHLESLALAQNRISDYYDLENLTDLPLLKEVSFRDVHFGACPVCSLDGYRSAALLALKHITVLDGIEVNNDDRENAKNEQLSKIVAYNNKVEELERTHEREMRSIEQRRKRVDAHAVVLEAEMKAAFSGLENIITSGRDSILIEHKRQVKVRKQNSSVLADVLSQLSNKYEEEIQKMIEEEETQAAEEFNLLCILETRTKFEILQNSILEQMNISSASIPQQEDQAGGSGFGFLGEHTPSFQLYARHLRSSQSFARHTDSSALLQLVRGYHVFSKSLAYSHANLTANAKKTDSTLTQLYWCGSKEDQVKLLKYGFGALGQTKEKYTTLHSDPSLALKFYKLKYGQDELIDDADDDYDDDTYNDDEEEEDSYNDNEEAEDPDSYHRNKSTRSNQSTSLPSQSIGRADKHKDEIGLVVLISCSISTDVVASCGKLLPFRPKSIEDLIRHAEKTFKNKPSSSNVSEIPNMSEIRYSLNTVDDEDDDEDEDDNYSQNSNCDDQSESTRNRKDGSKRVSSTEGGFALLVKTSSLSQEVSSRFYPEAHFLVASGSHGTDAKRLDRKLDELSNRNLPYNEDMRPGGGSSMGSGGGGISIGSGNGSIGGGSLNGGGSVNSVGGATGWNLLDELEMAVDEELNKYSERLWEGVDPDTADRLREADAEVSRKEEALSSLRGRIENERQQQESLIRNLQAQAIPSSPPPQNPLLNQHYQQQQSQHLLPPNPYHINSTPHNRNGGGSGSRNNYQNSTANRRGGELHGDSSGRHHRPKSASRL